MSMAGSNKQHLLWAAVLIGLLICLFFVQVNAEGTKDYSFSATPLSEALAELGVKFGVTIVVDPALTGVVTDTIHGNWTIEEALKSIIEPLGYSYTKVENYYLVNGPCSPLTVFAETESCLVPVGFLDSAAKAKLAEFNQYLTYSKDLGVVFVKAPTSVINKVLSKLWETSAVSSQISIMYGLQIVDLGSSSDLDSLFQIGYDDSKSDGHSVMVTPDELSLDSQASVLNRQKISDFSESVARQPWLIALPGKSVELLSNIHYPGDDTKQDQIFDIKLTPLKVDSASGFVITDVYINREEGHIGRLSTTVRSTPGSHELLAVVRQINPIESKTLWGKRKYTKHRDFAVLLSATPINVQSLFVAKSGVIPLASLGNIDRIAEPGPMVKRFAILKIGAAFNEATTTTSAWFDLNYPIGQQSNLLLNYDKSDRYSAGFSHEFEAFGGTYWEILAGKGVGPDDQSAAMLGVGDLVRPTEFLTLFGTYYPAGYLFDTSKYTNRGVWNAGTRIGTGSLGFTASVSGDPDYDGWCLKLDCNVKKHTWLFEYDATEKEHTTYLGMGFHF